MPELTPAQRTALAALCDTIVPAVADDPDPDGFFARRASDLSVPQVIEYLIADRPDEDRSAVLELLDALDQRGFAGLADADREPIVETIASPGTDAAIGLDDLRTLTLSLFYGLPDDRGQNPNWRTLGYPKPLAAPSASDTPLPLYVPRGDTILEADVCIVGSGAGGGVMAGALAARGLGVVVLEAGGHFTEADFSGLELPAYQNLYWRGGPSPSRERNVSLLAGSCLGGGTVVNWTTCLRPPVQVREQWETEFGLEGLAGTAFDRHLDAVWHRLSVTDRCSQLNGPQRRMKAGAQRLGWRFEIVQRNTDETRYSFDTSGYLGFGDASGAKQSTVKTYLRDAQERGATIVPRCRAERILVERGRASGVEAVWADPQAGRCARLVVRARQVVVACGALESPALLLRSRIGGPAVGNFLHLHPATATVGLYDEQLEAWRGAPQAGLIDEFASSERGHGFLIENPQCAPALAAAAFPFADGEQHKRLMSSFGRTATFIAVVRDRGHGRVTIDHSGAPAIAYALSDDLDVRTTRAATGAVARLHAAAGANEIVGAATGTKRWRTGQDLDAFIAHGHRIPLQAGGWRLFSAHQMGTCRMGVDPRTSVANPWGELHDVSGVWIGDASAFPTASGTNPMITVMALAHRTATAVAAAAGTSPPERSAPTGNEAVGGRIAGNGRSPGPRQGPVGARPRE